MATKYFDIHYRRASGGTDGLALEDIIKSALGGNQMIRAINAIGSAPDIPPRKRRRPKQSFRKAEVLRAMAAVQAGGLAVASVELRPDGTIRLSASPPGNHEKPDDEFATWQHRL